MDGLLKKSPLRAIQKCGQKHVWSEKPGPACLCALPALPGEVQSCWFGLRPVSI